VAHLRENLAVAQIDLSDEVFAELSAIGTAGEG
jgi:aryl-alcohol dehydrogenase-like predicted oxidoreductase